MKFTAFTRAALICAAAGGVTLNPRTGEINPKAGFALSESRDAERVQWSAPTADDLAGFYIRNAGKFSDPDGNPTGAHVGAWLDAASGKWFLDVVSVVADRNEALRRAKAAAQIAIFDLGAMEEIRCA